MTAQPCSPWRSVAATVSSTAVKNAEGIEPSSTSSPNRFSAAGSTRSPTVARNGFEPAPSSSYAAPLPTGRSTQIVVVSRNATATPNSSASVASMTCFWTSP